MLAVGERGGFWLLAYCLLVMFLQLLQGEHKQVMESQDFFVKNYQIELDEFDEALAQWDEK